MIENEPIDAIWYRVGKYEVQILSCYKHPEFAAKIILEGWKKCGCPKDSKCVRPVKETKDDV